ncbi:MAG: hypothetical protein WA667_14650 [Candidatus Nitrosopolaris sp.]
MKLRRLQVKQRHSWIRAKNFNAVCEQNRKIIGLKDKMLILTTLFSEYLYESSFPLTPMILINNYVVRSFESKISRSSTFLRQAPTSLARILSHDTLHTAFLVWYDNFCGHLSGNNFSCRIWKSNNVSIWPEGKNAPECSVVRTHLFGSDNGFFTYISEKLKETEERLVSQGNKIIKDFTAHSFSARN